MAFFALLACAIGMAAPGQAATFEARSRALLAEESCIPANNAIDPGETNTISFVIRNVSGGDRNEVKVRLLNTNKVAFVITGEQNLGTVPNNADRTVSFRFRADGPCNDFLTPVLQVTWQGASQPELVSFESFRLGAIVATPYSFSNQSPITINDASAPQGGRASPYPSRVTVSGVPRTNREFVQKVQVTLHNFSHPLSREVNIMLVAPDGTKIPLLSEAGGSTAETFGVNGATITFDDTATQLLQNSQLVSGTFTRGSFDPNVSLPDINGPTPGANLNTTFDNADVNGQWSLYVADEGQIPAGGTIAGGWTLTFVTDRTVCCGEGDTFPYISRLGAPGLPNFEVNEDVDFANDTPQDRQSPTLDFTAADLETSSVTVTAVSQNEALIRSSNIQIGGSGTARTLRFKPEPNQFGAATIVVTATDGSGKTATAQFTLTVKSVNDLPVISEIINQASNVGTAIPDIPFTVTDVESDPSAISIAFQTDAPAVVPVNNILLGGSGSNRTLTIIPANSGVNGQATISVIAIDPDGGQATEQFTVTFAFTPGQPVISPIDDLTIKEDEVATVRFRIASGSSVPVSSLTLTPSSGNTTLLPLNNITLARSGNDVTMTIRPAPNQPLPNVSPTSLVSLTLSDGTQTVTEQFLVTVESVNDKPTITNIPNQVINEDTSTANLSFTVGDVESGGNLTLTVQSSNPALVPPDTGVVRIDDEGNDRVIRITPAPNQFGIATITLRVRDPQGEETSTSFTVTVNGVNDPPVAATVDGTPGDDQGQGALPNNPDDAPVLVTVLEDVQLDNDGNPVEQAILVRGISGGPNEADQTVTVSATVDNTTLISGLTVDPATVAVGASTTRLKYKLGRNAYGTATVTLNLVDNGVGGTNSTTRKFKIDVLPQNDPPTLTDIPNRTIPRDVGVAIPITVSDVETPRPLLNVTAEVTGQSGVIDPEQLIFDAGNTTLTLVPLPGAADQSTTIRVTVTDRGATDDPNDTTTTRSVSDDFIVTVANVAPPTISVSPESRIVQEDAVASFNLTLGDDKPLGNLRLSGFSDNPAVVPTEGILFGGTGANRTVAIVPVQDAVGTARITITASDEDQLDSSVQFTVTYTPVDDLPTINLLGRAGTGNLSANEDANPVQDTDTDSDLIEFDVFDPETPSDQLQITVSSRNPENTENSTVVPPANIQISPTGTRRTVRITPAANQAGTAVITFTVRDATGKTAQDSFNLQINPINDPPTVDAIADRNINEDAGVQTVTLANVTAGPNETGQQVNITITARDDGTENANTLIDMDPNTGGIQNSITLSNVGQTPSFTFAPVANRSGISVLTLVLTDNGSNAEPNRNSTTVSFRVTIATAADAPTITSIPDQGPIPVNGETGLILFTIGDVETPADRLQVTASSSNATLVPNNPANLILTGTSNNRAIQVRPASNQAGTTTIQVTVRDEDGLTTTESFVLTVVPSDAPLISAIPDQNTPINTIVEIPFQISDNLTPPQNLILNITSGNSAVVPNTSQNIQHGLNPAGTGPGDRLLVIRPAANAIGAAPITITVTDGNQNTTTRTFTLNVLGAPPTITPIADREIAVGGSTGPIPFSISDEETFASLLILERVSSNPTFVPTGNIVFGGTGTNRTVTVNAAPGQGGESTITITVRDAEGQTASTSFRVFTLTQNTAPTISNIPDQNIATPGGSTGIINFTVNDAETFPSLLTVTGSSSNQALVPDGNITFGGTGQNRTVVVTTAPGQAGTAVITVTVSDGSLTAQDTFVVTVGTTTNPNAPTISAIPNQTTSVNVSTPLINFTVGDVETPAASLNVSAVSSNPALVPVGNIFLGGSGANRTLFITPAANQTGTATITVTVRDAGGRTATTSFTVTVTSGAANLADFNGDGRTDLIFQDNGGFLAAWFMDGTLLTSATLLNPNNAGDPNWKVVGSGNFNGDNEADLLFQHTDGALAVWYMNDTTLTSATLLNPSHPGDVNWRAAAVTDLNADGKSDVVFQHTDGSLAAWYMNGVDLVSATMLNPAHPGDPNWRLVAAGRFNGDNQNDLVFQHTNGRLAVWFMNGVDLVGAAMLNPGHPGDAQYRVVGAADLNGDPNSDLVFQHADGRIAAWFMNGVNLIRGELFNPSHPGGTWKIVAP